MKTLVVEIGNRNTSEFKRVIAELKSANFHFNHATKKWTKPIEDDLAEFWITQFRHIGIKVIIQD